MNKSLNVLNVELLCLQAIGQQANVETRVHLSSFSLHAQDSSTRPLFSFYFNWLAMIFSCKRKRQKTKETLSQTYMHVNKQGWILPKKQKNKKNKDGNIHA